LRVKIFSHGSDPDGIGCVVLAGLSYSDMDFTLCKNVSELDVELQTFINEKKDLDYDKIFITDLCPSFTILQHINENLSSKGKWQVFDHHLTSQNDQKQSYSWVEVCEEKDGRSCCGMSLFYDYLTKYASLNNSYVQEFVEMTRLHDTWEWKKKNHLEAYSLGYLFQALGAIGYYYHFLLKARTLQTFGYDMQEKNWIHKQIQKNEEVLTNMLKRLVIVSESNIKYGSVLGLYEYRNALAEKMKEIYPDLDVMILFAIDNETVSFRTLTDVEVESLAKEYGGGGHPRAASAPLTVDTELQLIKRFMMREGL